MNFGYNSNRILRFIYLPYILSFFVFSGFAIGQPTVENGVAPRKNMVPAKDNFVTFTNDKQQVNTADWKQYNSERMLQHPEFGSMAFNAPAGNLVEQLEKREADYRYFINPAQPSEFFIQKAMGNLHYKVNNQWLTINPHLRNAGNGEYKADRQPQEVGISLANKLSSIKTEQGNVQFNNWKLFGADINDTETLLATANWSNFTAGDDGVYITEIFPGIDATLKVMRGSLKTNFIVKSMQFSGFFSLIFKDEFAVTGVATSLSYMNTFDGSKKAFDRVQLLAGTKPLVEASEAIAYPKNGTKEKTYLAQYTINNNELGILIPCAWLQQHLAAGEVIVDPLVSGSNTLAQAAITGSMYNATCDFTTSCNYSVNVTPPAAAVLTNVFMDFNYIAQGICYMEDGATRFTLGGCTSPNMAGFYWFCNDPNPGTCTGAAIPVYPDLSSCLPGPSCTPTPINFGLQFFRSCYGNFSCSNDCIGAASPWTVTIQGQTLGFTNPAPNQFSLSSATVCEGQSITATSLGTTNGVGPYNTNWSLNASGIPSAGGGISTTINFPTSGSYTIYCIVTDACGSTTSASKTVTITPPPAAPTVTSPVTYCQNASASILTATGTSLQWYTVPTGGTPSGAPTPSTGAVGTTSYYVSQTVGGCESPRAQLNVVINAFPTFGGGASATPASCGTSDGGITGLTVTGSGTITYTWSNTVPAVVSTSTTNANLSNQPAGSYNLTVTDANGCSNTYGPVVITSAAAPAGPTVTSPVNYCQGAVASALTATGTALLWYTVPVGGVGSATAPTPSTTGVGTTSYYVSQTINGCESSRIQINVVINASPAAPVVTSPVNYCLGATANILTATGSGLLWYNVPTGGVGSATAPTPSTAVAGTVSYYVSQTTAGCEGIRAQINVVVSSAPVISGTAAITPSACGLSDGAISGFTATGNGALTYTWSNATPAVVSTSTTNANLSNQAAGSYSLTVSDASGCSSTVGPFAITNTSAPAAPTVTSPVTYCVGATASALNATGSNLQWYTIPVGGVGSATAPTPSTAVVGSTMYYVSQSVSGCESNYASIEVIISSPAAGPTVNSPVTYCLGATATALTAVGSNLLWYTVPTGGTGSSTAPTPSTGALGSTSYYVSQTVNGCLSATSQIDVIISPAPAAPTVTSPVTYCQGANASALVANGTNLLWYTDSIGGTGSVTAITPSTALDGTFSYYVSQSQNGCESPRTQIIVIVNPGIVPQAVINSTANTVCAGTLVSFSAVVNNAGGAPAFQWLLNGNPIAGQNALNYSSTALNNNDIISFQVISNAVCANPTQIISNTIVANILPNASPFVSITSVPSIVCVGQTVTINANAQFGGSNPQFIFRLNGAVIQTGSSNTFTSNQLEDGDVVSVLMSSNYLCLTGSNTVSSSNLTLIIKPAPTATASASDTLIISGQSTLLSASSSVPNPNYLWEPANNLVCDICPTTNANPPNTITYLLTVTDLSTGCIGTDTITIRVSHEFNIFVPSAFSPNTDDTNDDLFVRGTGIKSLKFEIYDRWGQKIFTTTDMKIGWDGTLHDKPVMQGVYVYYLEYEKYDGTFEQMKGNVSLFR